MSLGGVLGGCMYLFSFVAASMVGLTFGLLMDNNSIYGTLSSLPFL